MKQVVKINKNAVIGILLAVLLVITVVQTFQLNSLVTKLKTNQLQLTEAK